MVIVYSPIKLAFDMTSPANETKFTVHRCKIMTHKNRTLAAIASVVAAGFAGPAASQSGNANYDHVAKVQASSDNFLLVNVAGNFSSAHGCSQPWWARSAQTLGHSQTKAMLQISLSSLLARTPVHVWTNGCTSYGHPILTQIQIQEREPPPVSGPTPAPRDEPCRPSLGRPCP